MNIFSQIQDSKIFWNYYDRLGTLMSIAHLMLIKTSSACWTLNE